MDSPRHRRSAGALWLLLHDLDPPHLHLRQKSRSRKTREPARTRTSFGLRAIGVDDKRTHATFPRCPRVFGARTGFQTHSILQRSRAEDISKRGAAQWSWVPAAVDRRHREARTGLESNGRRAWSDPDFMSRTCRMQAAVADSTLQYIKSDCLPLCKIIPVGSAN